MKSVQGLKLDCVGREADVSDIVSFEPGPTANKQITKSVPKLLIKCLTGYLKTQIWKTVAKERPDSNSTFCKICSELISWKLCFAIFPNPEFKLQTNTTHFFGNYGNRTSYCGWEAFERVMCWRLLLSNECPIWINVLDNKNTFE